ncbi:hypothetical protein A9179_12840 [Pseudomonas alcaligenes]|uniref:DUF4386 domain-containing protein n=1 Tax=Aquipseudomonas alcaligenes TaxID=43263 RepID=A0ABR7S284_AQUAC|nr:hypothetical protein [Pseudomonas alcaligenes]MBC9251164.1 hypothetical protein [Pseudomonas alcaligenes]
MQKKLSGATRFTAYAAILGAIFAYTTITLSMMVTGDDTSMILSGAKVLSLPDEIRELYRWSMLTDIFGFYLPSLVVGGYLWHVFRNEAGALGSIAVLAIGFYATVGIIGAATQQAVVTPLAQLYGQGDASIKAAAEVTWTTIAYAVQYGLWWSEGLVVLFWGLVVGGQLKRAGWGWFSLLLLKIVGISFTLFLVFGFFKSLDELMKIMEMSFLVLYPLWLLIFGVRLLRGQGGVSIQDGRVAAT